ncbi:MAG: acetoacetate--CoA ligase [Gammaproteobacteria bacterium]|nr:MAG: acetoacetate--CoA ligase [Gammaproteobacteria bacterium]
MTESQPLWTPGPDRIAGSRLRSFMGRVAQNCGMPGDDYASLHRWSIEHPERFWSEVAAFCDLRFDTRGEVVLTDADRMPGARWFPGSTLNFAANLLKFRDAHPAIVFRDEAGRRTELSYAQLYAAVAQLAGALRAVGITRGDRVAGCVPNCPETVIAMLATTSIGAIWSSCSPDFGVAGVLDRFEQIRPRVLFAADGYRYDGKRLDTRPALVQIAARLDGLEHIVVFPFLDSEPDLSSIPNARHWAEFIATSQATEVEFAELPFAHPVYILYSSGTTGVPKCIVHGAGGTLLQHLKEHILHCDLGRDDTFFFFTTCGWMMWNWLVSGLASGATLVLYDGSPFKPDAGALWRIADEEGITIFGTGARYLAAVEKSTFTPGASCDLASMRTILSTGSPLAPSSFKYVYSSIKSDVALQSISGGTDLLGCFALGSPLHPVYVGELQCLGLGMDVRIFAGDGQELPAGHKGELVCTQPFPSMPVGFWADENDAQYRAAYFEQFANVWAHGDYAELTERGGMIISGRSDATLNPGGVRIGTAEIYRQVERLDEIVECVAVGQDWKGDTRIVLFVIMCAGVALDQSIKDRIRRSIRTNASPRHVPAKIVAVTDIPRTKSGKIVELAVRSAVHGEPVRNTSALANPEALQFFRNRPELA